ncbi:MAG TPA: outer membrane beta-barrel protein [Chitinophagaceae bacterium]|jgi:outer membrane protein W|nr:outer membrane beta-barrel protein [Chitinophagaceae bacterium]
MKKMSWTLLFAFAALLSNAQEKIFKPFKVDIATGYAIPSGKGSKAGAVFAIEPKYAVNDNISLGLRLEAAVTARGYVSNGQEFSGDVKASASYLATGDYYFNTNKFRPFAGVGAGIYSLASANFETTEEFNEDEINTGSKFGFAPRAGFEYGHFRTAIEYNAIGKTGNINNNYLSIKVGFFIGGGRY